jgi:hypothetical protein
MIPVALVLRQHSAEIGWIGGPECALQPPACQRSRPGQRYADRGAVFIGFTLGSFRRSHPPSRYDAPTMRVTTISESTVGRILGCLPRRTKRCARGQNGFQVDCGVNFK